MYRKLSTSINLKLHKRFRLVYKWLENISLIGSEFKQQYLFQVYLCCMYSTILCMVGVCKCRGEGFRNVINFRKFGITSYI